LQQQLARQHRLPGQPCRLQWRRHTRAVRHLSPACHLLRLTLSRRVFHSRAGPLLRLDRARQTRRQPRPLCPHRRCRWLYPPIRLLRPPR
jgi:hypothetical protein